MNKFNILFLGGGKRVSLAQRFIKAGKQLNLKTNVFAYELEKDLPFKCIGKVIQGKKWKDDHIYDDHDTDDDSMNGTVSL